jgi:hypothetical protein
MLATHVFQDSAGSGTLFNDWGPIPETGNGSALMALLLGLLPYYASSTAHCSAWPVVALHLASLLR